MGKPEKYRISLMEKVASHVEHMHVYVWNLKYKIHV